MPPVPVLTEAPRSPPALPAITNCSRAERLLKTKTWKTFCLPIPGPVPARVLSMKVGALVLLSNSTPLPLCPTNSRA
jgi:hypothetical protein